MSCFTLPDLTCSRLVQFVAPQGMRIAPGQALLFCPIGGGMSDSIYTGASADDHSGGSDAGVAYGHDPSGGEMAYQFGNLWVGILSCQAECALWIQHGITCSSLRFF